MLAHPRALPHLVSPERLLTAVRGVYGDAVFDSLYGGIEAVPAHRARSVDNGEVRGSLLGKGGQACCSQSVWGFC